MICYPADANEDEILAVNDYWLLSDQTFTGFLYTLEKIDSYYRSKRVRPISVLAKKSSFISDHLAFDCEDCRRKTPAINRKDYKNRTKAEASRVCPACSEMRQQKVIEDARETLRSFKEQEIQPEPYLDSLTLIEALALMTLMSEQADDDQYLAESPEDLNITGVPSIDYGIFLSLVSKNALTHISHLPIEVVVANSKLFGEFDRLQYESRYRSRPTQYRPPDAVAKGVYFNPLDLYGRVCTSDISSILHQQMQSSTYSVKEVENVHQLIKEMQLAKLYQLTIDIGSEFQLQIDNSNSLRALLEHLAENYRPMNIYFCFRVKAREIIVYMHTNPSPHYIARHYFAKFVGNYIQFIENTNRDLEKVWNIPPTIQISPFEALFSRLYLDKNFNWNALSAKEIVALWLDNVCVSEDAREPLIEKEE